MKSFLCIALVECDFEDGLCGMEQVNWRVGSGSTPTKNTGPDYDHTTFLPEGALSDSFLFVFPFGKAPLSATNHLINSKLHQVYI